jgi:hypothetical protein
MRNYFWLRCPSICLIWRTKMPDWRRVYIGLSIFILRSLFDFVRGLSKPDNARDSILLAVPRGVFGDALPETGWTIAHSPLEMFLRNGLSNVWDSTEPTMILVVQTARHCLNFLMRVGAALIMDNIAGLSPPTLRLQPFLGLLSGSPYDGWCSY